MKLKKVLGLGSWLLGLLAIIIQLSTLNSLGQGTPLASTAFTRGILRSTNSAEFRNTLGFLTTNNTVITNYVGNGASITNLNADELRSGTVPLARLSGITASQIADSTLTTNKIDSTFYNWLTNTGSGGSGDVTQAGLAAGSYSLSGSFSPVAMLNTAARGRSSSPGSYGDSIGTSENTVIAGSGKSGILRKLFCHLDVGSTGGLETNINKLELLIYTDGTATGNLTARVKVADLLNCYYRYPTTNWSVQNFTRYLSYIADPLPSRTGLPLYHFTLNIPMPFTNGISVKLTNTTAGTTWTHGYFQAQYDAGTLRPELLSTRFYITNIHGAQSAGSSNFLFTVPSAAEIIGFQHGISNNNISDAVQNLADKGLSFYLDSSLWRYDLDDWMENTYAAAFGQFLADDVGWPFNQYDEAHSSGEAGAVEGYKWMGANSIHATNNIIIYADGNTGMDDRYWNFFYYKK